jgi:glycosyltransferase involved in cell wall biosynthesis
MGAVHLSLLFPARNEEATIREVIEEADSALRHAGFSYEIIVLDDGSTDRTWSILLSLLGTVPDLRLLRHEHNQGIMPSLNDLLAASCGDWIFHNGSDGQWKTAEVLRMLPLTREFPIVVGKRRQKHYTLRRRIVSALFNVLPLVLFGVRTHDAGSIKVYPRKLLSELTLVSKGPFQEAERLIRAANRGYRIGVISVDSYPRRAGKASGARPGLVLAAVADLARCWWRIVICRAR